MFFQIGVLKSFVDFAGNAGASFLTKLQAWRPATLLKRDTNTDFFLWNLQNFKKHLVLQNIPGGYFWPSQNNRFKLLHEKSNDQLFS